ncbi:hypothetical protein COX26_00290 [Candidatus Jorgensenbacteria bacterium CG23_combo_of_CG06-09_8_20_14_all_54_14]|uniref:Uncharacterized protein n=1 Tax=Candidatus Jorgensenbacteria bacterium CG23_combo_of_CG06-09_8_20_14_all_54_14 TaxID=1974595 RepID=A0A2G9ZAF2_9BACT|nr:MAG: hypothetical protein COX26_00290 [Candidatus Jorgensenbacteria bacterium CG23_combo_of_CG06-09_8_20_14_all_54_14]
MNYRAPRGMVFFGRINPLWVVGAKYDMSYLAPLVPGCGVEYYAWLLDSVRSGKKQADGLK